MVTISVYVYREDTASFEWFDAARDTLDDDAEIQLSNVNFDVTEQDSSVNFSGDGSSPDDDINDLIDFVFDNDYYEGDGTIHLYVTDDYTDGVGQDNGADSGYDGFAVAGITDAFANPGYYENIVIHEVLHNIGADHEDGTTISGCFTPMAILEDQEDECHVQNIATDAENAVENYVSSNY